MIDRHFEADAHDVGPKDGEAKHGQDPVHAQHVGESDREGEEGCEVVDDEQVDEVDAVAQAGQGHPHAPREDGVDRAAPALGWKFMSFEVMSRVGSTWLLIGCSLLCSQLGASVLVDTTFDNDYTSRKFPPQGSEG